MANSFIPKSSINLISKGIDEIFEDLKRRLLGSFYSQNPFDNNNKYLSLPGVYTSAFISGGSKKTPNPQNIQNLAVSVESYINSIKEKFKAKTFTEIEQQLTEAPPENFEELLNESLAGIFDKAQGEAKQVIDTELHRAKTIGVNDSVEEFARDEGDTDPTVYALTRMDNKVCVHCKELYEHEDKTPRVYKLSELSSAFYDKKSPSAVLPPVHPNCLLNGDARVITKKGFVPIKMITIGDEVLTHKLRWKKVINTLNWYTKSYSEEYYKVAFIGKNSYEISVTPEHKLLTPDGFQEVRNIKKPVVMVAHHKCKICDSERKANYPGYFCTSECRDIFLSNPVKFAGDMLETDEYILKEVKVSISRYPDTLPSMLYDITVEDDHSFICNGIVSHNCRCLLLYLPKGYKVLPGGKLEYVDFEYDEYEKQKVLKKNLADLAKLWHHDCNHEQTKF